jgi:asparagine synthase (glutamine-hydrolysing)
MCGIAGLIGAKDRNAAEKTLCAMVNAIARRGPDGEGVEHWPGAALGHRRLAILDLSEAGRQPMLSDDHSVGVVFNGCIYNFLELRTELEKDGHRFHSDCDTEVLVRGYQAWGVDRLVSRLRGMFAFAVWDDHRQTLFLVRDRLGVKPLIYATSGGQIAFASTVPALRAAGFNGAIDPQAVQEFLAFNFITDDRTIYQGVSKLAAGTILEWKNGAFSTRSYWSVPHPEEVSPIRFEEAVEETERLLIESVRLRLFADVPIGVLLSSGVDSALVCWAMSKLNANIMAFTVSTPGDPADEAGATQETANLLGIPHRVVTLPAEAGIDMLGQLTQAYGEPFGAQSAVAMLRVSEAVKPYATVLLTGDGGDDVFLGYHFYQHYWNAQQIARKLPSVAAPLWRAVRPAVSAVPALRRPKHFLDYATGGLAAVARAGEGMGFYRDHDMVGERLAHLKEPEQRNLPLSMKSARNLLPELLEYQQRMWFTGHFMTKVDGGTMYHALEARAPFLDQVLWEFAAKLPLALRLRGGELKAVLREIVRRRISPAVAVRKKQGFTIPVERWIASRGHWGNAVESVAGDSLLERDGWIRPGALLKAYKRASERGVAPTQLWQLVVLEHWMRHEASGSIPR